MHINMVEYSEKKEERKGNKKNGGQSKRIAEKWNKKRAAHHKHILISKSRS